MNGKILDSVGFSKVEGTIRQLTIRERLLQIQMSKIDGELVHPVHGKIVVDISKVGSLLAVDESHLFRYKLSMFVR